MARKSKSNRGKKGRKPTVHDRNTLSFDKRVLSVLNDQRELKVSRPFSFETEVNSGVTVASCLSIMPPISQGDNEYQRSGNQITLMKIVINSYYTNTFPVDSNRKTRPMVERWILKQNNSNAVNVINGTTPFLVNNFLENSQAHTGTIINYNTPVNKNAFTVRRERKRVLPAPNSQGPVNQNTGSIDKSFWMIQDELTFGKGKKLNYRTSGANDPVDFDYFLCHQASPMGEPAYAAGETPIYYTQTVTAYYYDS